MTVITHEELRNALRETLGKKGISDAEIAGLAEYILCFFGYEDTVLDNILMPKDRDVFYMLEEAGLLTTEQEEIQITKGKLWRIHYWLIKKDQIKRLSAKNKKKKGKDKTEEKAPSVYDSISDEDWKRHDTTG